ncbi:MAG: hypothetical protein ABSC55_03520 [Syntrophorhabdales bacterium]|jgi:hypothetical protein
MVRIEPGKEEWIDLGIDDDGTEAFLDASSIVRDLETTLCTAWMKHIPPQTSRTYKELAQALKIAKKDVAPPDHVRQFVEIDCVKGLSRTLNLVVCDKQDTNLDVISFRFPDWTEIDENSIIDKARATILDRFPDRAEGSNEPLKFTPPRVHVKPERIEVSKRWRIADQPSDLRGKLKLEEVDV